MFTIGCLSVLSYITMSMNELFLLLKQKCMFIQKHKGYIFIITPKLNLLFERKN